MKAIIVTHKTSHQKIPFTLGIYGEVIVTDLRNEYSLDDLIVSIVDRDITDSMDNRFFVLVPDRVTSEKNNE